MSWGNSLATGSFLGRSIEMWATHSQRVGLLQNPKVNVEVNPLVPTPGYYCSHRYAGSPVVVFQCLSSAHPSPRPTFCPQESEVGADGCWQSQHGHRLRCCRCIVCAVVFFVFIVMRMSSHWIFTLSLSIFSHLCILYKSGDLSDKAYMFSRPLAPISHYLIVELTHVTYSISN
jgi:hypothetical protein